MIKTTLKKIVDRNKFKQVSASILEQLNKGDGNVKLLPSSKNYDWWTTEKEAKDNLCLGKVITLGRARYSNTKYHDGLFVSSNNHIINSKDEKVLNPRYL